VGASEAIKRAAPSGLAARPNTDARPDREWETFQLVLFQIILCVCVLKL
jgi:hypothetical protein